MSIFQLVAKAVDTEANEFRNVHHYEFFGYTPDNTQLQEFVDNVDGVYKTELQAFFHEDIEIYAYDVRQVDIGDLPSIEYVPTAGAWNGTASTNRTPNQVAAMATFKAVSSYPRSSRTYLFPCSETATNALGRVSAGVVDDIDDWAQAMLEIDITGGLNADKQAVQYGGSPRVVTDSNDLTTVVVRNIFRTQRRRTPGVGI